MPEKIGQLAFTRQDLAMLSGRLLNLEPDPAPRFLILRDLLGCASEDPALQSAGQALQGSHWIRELEAAQLPDGSWGRFHTQDTCRKTPFPTSEFAIRRALALGLDRRSPMLQKAGAYIMRHLRGEVEWRDHPEKHDHPGLWAASIPTISAAMLSLIDPDHPGIDPLWEHWADVVSAAFASGAYDPAAELARRQALTGIPSRRFAPFHTFYPLVVLSSPHHRLPDELERQLLAFVLHKPGGIYYICEKPLDCFPHIDEKGFESWGHALEVLSRFRLWPEFAPPLLNWIWEQRGPDGLWDIGPGAFRSTTFPLSESHRRPLNRRIDASVWILNLLMRVCG